nr:cupin [Pseudomonas sp. BSw22131]
MFNIAPACLLLAMIAFGGCATAKPSSSASVSTVQSTVLLKSSNSWDGTAYDAYPVGKPELTVLNIKIPANTAPKWHEHPMPNAQCGVCRVRQSHDGNPRRRRVDSAQAR